MAYQNGSIRLERDKRTGRPLFWLAIWREDVVQADGSVKRVQRSRKLADHCDRYRSESDVRPLLDAIVKPLNGSSATDSCRTMLLSDFIESVYLPWVKEQKRPSVHKAYRGIWRNHVQKHVNGTYLRDFMTTDGSRLLQAIAHESDLSITTFKHIKAMLSGVFTYAKNEGLFDGANPVQDVFLPNARPEGDTFAYFLPEICQMVTLLPEPARTIVATAAFTGLREGELRGLDVTDFNGETLRVSRSIWRSHVNAPKGAGEVPVIGPLAAMLTMHIWHAWGIR